MLMLIPELEKMPVVTHRPREVFLSGDLTSASVYSKE